MHQSSYDKMQAFRDRYLGDRTDQPLRIYDLGSQDVNGSYRPLFTAPAWRYVGTDIAAGKNVDLVLSQAHRWKEIPSASADILISGQMFEHVEFIWSAMSEVARVLKPGGLCCIIAPSGGPEHRYPVDCWRIYPDGFAALARYAGLEVVELSTQWDSPGYTDGSDQWHDSLLVARRPARPGWRAAWRAWRRRAGLG